MTRPSPVKGDAEAREADDLAEAIVFRWYTLAQEEHDMLSREGLDSLSAAIKGVLVQEGLATPRRLTPKPARKKKK